MESKSFFHQFSEDIEKEVKEYDAREYKKDILSTRCPHKDTTIIGDILRCVCGATWQGPRIEDLQKILKRDTPVSI